MLMLSAIFTYNFNFKIFYNFEITELYLLFKILRFEIYVSDISILMDLF